MTDLKTDYDMIAVGAIPIHPGVLDFKDAEGKVVLFVRDEEEGRSVFMGVKMYGEIDRLYEVRYQDFEEIITKMMGEVIMADAEDPYMELLREAEND